MGKTLAHWHWAIQPMRSLGEAARWGYRTSLCLAARWDGHSWLFGLRRGLEVIPIPRCPIHSPRANAVIALLGQGLPPAQGFPLFCLMLSGAQCVLVVKGRPPCPTSWLMPALWEQLQREGVEGLWAHHNPSAGKRALGKGGWFLLAGQARSRDPEGLAYGPAAFQQQLGELHRQALAVARGFLAPTGRSAVVDLYCGTGATLREWRAGQAEAIGVEVCAEAVECAAINAPGVQVLRGPCWQRLPQLREWARAQSTKEILLYVNPPRSGLEPEVLEWVGRELRPQRIAYLSPEFDSSRAPDLLEPS